MTEYPARPWAEEVAHWRRAERTWLLAERAALSVEHRHAASEQLSAHLDRVLVSRFGSVEGLKISAW